MDKMKKIQCVQKTVRGLLILMVAVMISLSADQFKLVSYAVSEGKVTASSAKIRKEPRTDSEALSGVSQDASLSIKGQIAGADGYTWYQVFIDANTLGYIRSDLVSITDGTTPPTVTATVSTDPVTGGETVPATTGEPQAVVTPVNPVSGNVTGGKSVRVREDASTASKIVTTAESGLALTVVGSAVGTDGKDWYQVNYFSNSSEINGFIRSDYIALDGELVPAVQEEPEAPQEFPEEPVQEPEEVKEWDTYYDEGIWHLKNNETGYIYDIESIFEIAEDNKVAAEAAISAKKKQQAVIIILVILMLLLVTVISYLIFKVRELKDSMYIKDLEQETVRRRTADRPQGGGQRTAQGAGGERRQTAGQKPAESRNAGQKPAGQRAASQTLAGQRPVSQRPVSQRPAGTKPERTTVQPGKPAQEPGWKSKNFMVDDDEFEVNFISGDGDDK